MKSMRRFPKKSRRRRRK